MNILLTLNFSKERYKTEKEFNNSTNLDSRSQNVSLSDSHEFKLNGSMRNAFFKSNIRKEKMSNTSKNFNINAIKEAGIFIIDKISRKKSNIPFRSKHKIINSSILPIF